MSSYEELKAALEARSTALLARDINAMNEDERKEYFRELGQVALEETALETAYIQHHLRTAATALQAAFDGEEDEEDFSDEEEEEKKS